MPTACYAAIESGAPLVPHSIERRAVHENDVAIDIKFAGICHSDIHQAKSEWGPGIFPMVPGHEIGGIVTAVGSGVTSVKVGDTVGVGCMVDSCRDCDNCRKGDENYCPGVVWTYNGTHSHKHCVEHNDEGGSPTYGGYSKDIVVNKDFVCNIPTNLDLAGATPLLCAGVTMYSPMIHYGLQSHHKFGVVGMGGLGHMGAKMGVAFGCHTTVISRGTKKKQSCIDDFGIHNFVDSTNAEDMAAAKGSMDMIICTVSAQFDPAPYLELLKQDGKFIIVGVPPAPLSLNAGQLIFTRKSMGGSLIGGIRETQEMLDFCGRHNITCDIEMIDASKINEAYVKTIAGDVKYRFVIDTATM